MMSPEILHQGRFLTLLKEGRWEYVARRAARGAVFVLAVTPSRCLVLVEQFRIPAHSRTLELPAGILGDTPATADETPEACALRELEEETGFCGRRARLLLSGPVAPGLTSELLYLVRVDGLRRVGPGGGVDGENITVHEVPLVRINAWLRKQQREGLLVDSRVYTALCLLMLRHKRRPTRARKRR